MQQFARGMGILSVASGLLLMFFPKETKRVMEVRSEFTRLSIPALRLLGVWELMMGGLLVGSTTAPAAEMRRSEAAPTEFRKAA
jgi:uncharacterized protein YjeT (DUF2065 family)